jgi:D-alanyl-D-alanine carboxypeptidase/D-alanyl-D-alanine-endopeptidase (penicillin-binding protein 4)
VPGDTVGPPITTALARVVKQCNTESQNLYAESLLKRIGAKRSGQSGTWANGAAAIAAEVDAVLGAGTAAKGLVVADGSGLCKEDRVAPNLMTAWLRAIATDAKISQAFINSLAVAGVSGTVQKRFKGLDTERVFVPCKTGYINGVSCLSGFVGRPGETPRFAFSVFCNDLTKDKDKDGVGKAKALQEKIVMILAGGM